MSYTRNVLIADFSKTERQINDGQSARQYDESFWRAEGLKEFSGFEGPLRYFQSIKPVQLTKDLDKQLVTIYWRLLL